MRIEQLDGETVFGMSILTPRVEIDRFNSDVTLLKFPDYTYRMVHHSQPQQFRQYATIYGGRDMMLKFSSNENNNPTSAHWVRIDSAHGEFFTSWGDGDNLGFTYPKLDNNTAYRDAMRQLGRELSAGGDTKDNECFFLMRIMWVINTLPDPWLSKDEWEVIKEARKTERDQSYAKADQAVAALL